MKLVSKTREILNFKDAFSNCFYWNSIFVSLNNPF